MKKGVKENVKSFFQGNDSSANNPSELSDADYGITESGLIDGESMQVDSFEFEGSEIADTDGCEIVDGVMDFLGGFLDYSLFSKKLQHRSCHLFSAILQCCYERSRSLFCD